MTSGMYLENSALHCASSLNHIWFFATLWTVARQAPLPTGILQARMLEQVAYPSSRRSSRPRIEPASPVLQADSLPAELPGNPLWKL